MKRPEYTAAVTEVYSKVIKERRAPTQPEYEQLERAFSREGFTQGYFNGEIGPDMFGTRQERSREQEKFFNAVRKQYADSEVRRVPVDFYAVIREGQPVQAAVADRDGHRAVVTGGVPPKAERRGVTEQNIRDQMYKTGGTPYYAENVYCEIDPGLHVTASEVNELRRKLISELTAQRAKRPDRRVQKFPRSPRTASSARTPA